MNEVKVMKRRRRDSIQMLTLLGGMISKAILRLSQFLTCFRQKSEIPRKSQNIHQPQPYDSSFQSLESLLRGQMIVNYEVFSLLFVGWFTRLAGA
jgi:hypothetical protein